ncbi:hypothetical protein Ciccas_002994 [Cichlidogyrus casuarinus]|uniref:Uncharacterized protein n=1 Tax=Cichlidogyrus casuarinus TaxID=1844966 RepID=A0ABD2QG23_9PLAT
MMFLFLAQLKKTELINLTTFLEQVNNLTKGSDQPLPGGMRYDLSSVRMYMEIMESLDISRISREKVESLSKEFAQLGEEIKQERESTHKDKLLDSEADKNFEHMDLNTNISALAAKFWELHNDIVKKRETYLSRIPSARIQFLQELKREVENLNEDIQSLRDHIAKGDLKPKQDAFDVLKKQKEKEEKINKILSDKLHEAAVILKKLNVKVGFTCVLIM